MATKDQNNKAMPMQKAGQTQQNKTGKESRKTAANNTGISDLEQKSSSNKGKGPSGENL